MIAAQKQSYGKLTARQESVLRMIVAYIDENGYPPSIRNIGESMVIGSLRGVTVHLDALERKGYISRSSTPRSIRILHPAYSPGKQATMVPLIKGYDHDDLLGEWNVERQYPVSAKIVAVSQRAFMVRVRGDAMARSGLLPRDLAVCAPQSGYKHSDLVVICLDGDLLVRRLEYRGVGPVLVAANSEFPDVLEEPDCRILGRVVGLMRDYEGEAF